MLDRGRQNLMLMANFLVAGGVELRVRVRDISAHGVKIDAPQMLPAGLAIRIELPSLGWQEGTVAWTRKGRCGIHLNAMIDPAAVRQAVSGTYVRPPVAPPLPLRYAS